MNTGAMIGLRGPRGGQAGFTLLEMVIAIAIFAVVGAVSYTTLDRFLRTRDVLDARNQATRQLQRAVSHFERDVRFMTPRTVRDQLGEIMPALATGAEDVLDDSVLIEMTVAQPSFRNARWHRLRRVGWTLIDGRLIRQVWPVLDREFDSAPRQTALLEGVSSVTIRYYGRDADSGEIDARSDWEEAGAELPMAVELILTLDDDTTYRRLVEVANVSTRS